MNWSDDENNQNDIMAQPSRDMPESASDSENDEQLHHIIMKTSKNTNFMEIKEHENKKTQKKSKQQATKNILTNLFKNDKIIERKFNPRLPPPNKYKK